MKTPFSSLLALITAMQKYANVPERLHTARLKYSTRGVSGSTPLGCPKLGWAKRIAMAENCSTIHLTVLCKGRRLSEGV